MLAAGAEEVAQEARYARLVGASRMGSDPAQRVVDALGRTRPVSPCEGGVIVYAWTSAPASLPLGAAEYSVRSGLASPFRVV